MRADLAFKIWIQEVLRSVKSVFGKMTASQSGINLMKNKIYYFINHRNGLLFLQCLEQTR